MRGVNVRKSPPPLRHLVSSFPAITTWWPCIAIDNEPYISYAVTRSNAWFPPLPFFRSVATVAVAGENGNAGNVFPNT